MVYYEPVKITINASSLAKVILNIIVRHHGLLNSIVSDWGLVFSLKFWSLLCYFLKMKWRLSTAFHPQTDDQTERQNSTMKAYFWAFVNFEQNDLVKLLPMAEFAYNNVKTTSTSYTPFELNCGYHPRTSYKKDVDPCFELKSAEELANKLKNLMTICKKNL